MNSSTLKSPMTYQIPDGVQLLREKSQRFLTTPQKGRVLVDPFVGDVWQFANGKSLDNIIQHFQNQKLPLKTILSTLVCLVEGGFLERCPEQASSSSSVFQMGEDSPRPPLISVVVVAYKGKSWLVDLIPDLLAQSYQPLEIIVVDNAREPELQAWLAAAFPMVRYLLPEGQTTFAAGVNLGVSAARGDYTVILNQDLRLDPHLVGNLYQYAKTFPQAAAIAPKLKFLWAPAFLNAIGNRVGASSWGSDNLLGHLDLGQFDHWREISSACFACVMIPSKMWDVVGAVDEGYEMYYEDTDWCYRARLLGLKVIFAPEAEAFHAFGGKVPDGSEEGLSPEKLRKVVYSRYRFATRIVGQQFDRFINNYQAEDRGNLDHEKKQGNQAMAAAIESGMAKFEAEKADLLALREEIQAQRQVGDGPLFTWQKSLPENISWRGLPVLTRKIIEKHYLSAFLQKRTRHMPEFDYYDMRPHLLIVSHDIVDFNMAGPGMRYLEMARALSPFLPVSLAIPNQTEMQVPDVNLLSYSEQRSESLQVLTRNADVILISGYMGVKFPFLLEKNNRICVDLYDPLPLENLHYYLDDPIEVQNQHNQSAVDALTSLLDVGDFFICGNERQRDLWIGSLMNLGRINPQHYLQDPSFRRFIDVVGTGFRDQFPETRPYLRGVHEAIPENAKIVLWGGGIWNWLDPISLIKAWPKVVAEVPEARLVFLGTKHPNPAVPAHEMALKAVQLAENLGEKDHSIIFIEWVPFDERVNLLAETDIGVTMHPVHIETRYSIRTRVIDYFWAKLPVVITEGDITSEWIQKYNLGRVVPEHDPDAIAVGLLDILQASAPFWEEGFDQIYADFKWSKLVQPLVDFCLQGDYAPDRPKPEKPLVHDHRLIIRGKKTLKRVGLFRFIWLGVKYVFNQVRNLIRGRHS